MSQANVEIVRRATDFFNDRDLSGFLDHFDHTAEWIEDPRYPGAETFRGPLGIERSIRKWWEAWAELTMEIDETIDLGDRLLVSGRVHARGHRAAR